MNFTVPIVKQLQTIHDHNFSQASESIQKYQAKYKEQYDKKHNTQEPSWEVGDKVQYMRYASKKPKSKSALSKWSPFRSYYEIYKIDSKKKQITLKTAHGKLLKRYHHFDRVRKYRGSS